MTEPDFDALAPGSVRRTLLIPDVGHPVEIPCHLIRGERSGPTLLVTAGVHGAEYASIEAAQRIARTSAEGLSGTLVVLPLINPPSYFARSPYINPVDRKNLNRVFPGRADGSFAERLARWLSDTFIARADAFCDLHGGDLVEALTPFTIHPPGDEAAALAQAFGLEHRIVSDGEGMSYAAGRALGVPSLIAEAGGEGQWPEVEVKRLVAGVERVMQHLGMRPGTPEPQPVKELTEFAWLRSEHAGGWYPAVRAGERVRAGQPLGEVRDLLGEVLQRAVSPIDGVVLFSVSSLAMNDGDPLVGIGA